MRKRTVLYRIFEIIPGTFMWLLLIGPIILSFYYPDIVMAFLIVYAIYWLIKAISLGLHLIAAYFSYKSEIIKDWRAILKQDFPDNYREIYHMLIIATYKEDYLTLKQTFDAIKDSEYDLDRVVVLLATEERDHDNAQLIWAKLKNEFKADFYALLTYEHPKDIPGEVIGKGGNITFSARQSLDFFKKKNIDIENVIVTTLDADHRIDKKYLACVTEKYLSTPERNFRSYQPLPMFFNNIWEVPIPMRILAVGSSFWQMIESVREYRLRNFAAHAQPLAGLIKTDFWATDTIVEDGHQYWRSYFAFEGNYQVVPIFVPIYQDAVLAQGYLETFRQQYLQKRRWAYGVSDFPYIVTKSLKDRQISWWEKLVHICRSFEGNLSWSTNALILSVVAWIPFWLGTAGQSVLSYNFPLFYLYILRLAAIGMLITLTVTTLLLPPVPKKYKNSKLKILSEWILTPFLIPFTNIFFGALPAIDSQTRLMLGRYLNKFNVTPKKAIKIDQDRHA